MPSHNKYGYQSLPASFDIVGDLLQRFPLARQTNGDEQVLSRALVASSSMSIAGISVDGMITTVGLGDVGSEISLDTLKALDRLLNLNKFSFAKKVSNLDQDGDQPAGGHNGLLDEAEIMVLLWIWCTAYERYANYRFLSNAFKTLDIMPDNHTPTIEIAVLIKRMVEIVKKL